jgi:N-acetylglucosamine kinase-like BadF-type ATPase
MAMKPLPGMPSPDLMGATPIREPAMPVLAVDGGQSSIRVRHSGGGPDVEVGGVSRLEGDVIGGVTDAVVEGWRRMGRMPVDRVVLGLTTAPADRHEQRELCSLVGRSVDARQVWLADDAVTTHIGALSMGWGVSVTVGTGVASLALPDGEAPARTISGHGFLLGDEGGGYWIGREGLRAVLRADDGRGPATRLSGAAVTRFGRLRGMSARIHALPRAVNAIAQFAPDVLQLAEAGDPEAERIVRESVTELTAVVRAGCRAVAGKRAEPGSVPVAFGGRLLTPGTILRRWLEKSVATELPQAATRDADGTPLDGAMRLGLQPGPGRYSDLVTRWADEL